MNFFYCIRTGLFETRILEIAVTIFLLAQILPLTGLVGDWAVELSQLSRRQVVVISLRPGELPAQEPHRSVAKQHFAAESFGKMFASAQALSLNPPAVAGGYQYIFVNQDLAPKDPEALTGLLAHELGHLWIKAQGYPAPRYLAGEAGCLSVAAGDALQHILMRSEMDRRGIRWRAGFVRQLEPALRKLEEDANDQTAAVPRCQKLAQVSLWLDVALGITALDWEQRGRFLELLEKRFPDVAQAGKQLAAELGPLDLADKKVHRMELERVFDVLKQFALKQP